MTIAYVSFWRFTVCQFVFSYFTKLRTMITIWKILPATRSNGKQNFQFKKQRIDNNAEAESTAVAFDV